MVTALAILFVPMLAGATLVPADGSPYPVGSNPLGLGVADFNGDNELDIVTSNGGSQDVSLLLGDGTGGFSEASGSPFDPEHQSQRLEVGDVNGDGFPDVVTTTTGIQGIATGTASVLLGDGAGGLATSSCSPFDVSFRPVDTAIGDFNEDGDADLAIPNSFLSLGVDIELGDGTGCFTESSGSPFAAGTTPRSVVAADFDEDGHLDLAVPNQGSKDVSVLLGDGTGSFETSSISLGGRFGEDAAIGDFNEDGHVDLAVSNFTFFSTTVLLGDGNGGFANATGSPLSLGALTQGVGVAVGDIDADGHDDIVTAASNEDTVVVHLGTGTGAFVAAPGSPLTVGDAPQRVVVADFDHDGRDDVAAANTASSDVTVLLSAEDDDTTPPTTTVTRSPGSPSGANGWYTTPVGISIGATDDASSIAETRCELDPDGSPPASFGDLSSVACAYLAPGADVTEDGEHTVYAASEDTAGNAETPVSTSFKIDRTAPIVACPSPIPTFVLGSTGNLVSADVSDSGSGALSATASAAASATSVGVHGVDLTGQDQAGNATTVSCSYLVAYKVLELSPAPGSIWRGRTIPVRFGLGDANDVRISDAEAASLLSPVCRVEFSATGAASEPAECVRYDDSKDQFVYTWKVGKGATGAATITIDVSYGTATASTSASITIAR